MKPANARRLRRVSIAILAVLVLLVAGLAWLLGTSSGARVVVGFAQKALPVTVGRVSGSLLGTLVLQDIAYDDSGASVGIERVAVSVGSGVLWNFRHVEVLILDVEGILVSVPAAQATSTAPAADIVLPEIPSLSLPLRLAIVDARLSNVRVDSGEMPLVEISESQVSGVWDGDEIRVDSLSVAAAQGNISANGAVILDQDLVVDLAVQWQLPGDVSGELVIRGNRDDYSVTHQLFNPLRVETRGNVRAPAGLPVTVDLVNNLDAYRVVVSERAIDISDVELAVSGRWNNWLVRMGAGIDGSDIAPGRISVNATGAAMEVVLDRALVELTDGAKLSTQGTLSLTDDPAWDMQLQASNLPVSTLFPDLPGVSNAQLATSGRWGSKRNVYVDVEALEGSYREAQFSAAGIAEWREASMRFESIGVTVGQNRVVVDGRLEENGDVVGDIDIAANDLTQLLPELSGALTATASVSGSRQRPVIEATLQTDGIRWNDFQVGTGRGVLAIDADTASADVTLENLAYAERTAQSVTITLTGTQAAHSLSVVASMRDDTPISLSAVGGYEEGLWEGALEKLEGRWPAPDLPVSGIDLSLTDPASLAISGNRYALGDFCLQTNIAERSCGRVTIAGANIDLNLEVNAAAIDAFIPSTVTGVQWTGLAYMTATLNGPMASPSGSAELRFEDLLASQQEGGEIATLAMRDVAFSAEIDNGELSVDGGLGFAQSGEMSVNVQLGNLVADDAPVSGSLTARTDELDALNALLGSFQLDGGTLNAYVGISGSRLSPVFDSKINIESLEVRVVPLGVVLSDVSLSALNNGTESLSFEGQGISGDGRFSISGETVIDSSRQLDTRANITAERVTFIDLPDRFAVASVDVNLLANSEVLDVKGALSVDLADILVQGLPEGAVRVSNDERIIRDDDTDTEDEVAVQRRTIEVDVTLTDEVRLTGFGLKAGLGGELTLREADNSGLQGFGALDLRDATYSAYGQALDISRGTILFNGPLDAPLLDFRAQRSVDETQVGIDIVGTPGALESSLFSTPSLPDAEVLSLLLTGRSLASTGQTEGTAMADAAITLGLRQAFGVSSAIRDIVDLDTLTVVGSGRDGRVLAGKQLSPNLYLQYAYGVFDQLSTILVRLKLSERLSLESATGDEQYVDLIYSVGRN